MIRVILSKQILSVVFALLLILILMPWNMLSAQSESTQPLENQAWKESLIDVHWGSPDAFSMTNDSEGFCYIAYYDAYSCGLKYATDKTGTWNATLLESGNADYPVGNQVAICVDLQGNVHIAYHAEYAEYAGRQYVGILKCASNIAGNWTYDVIDNGGVDSHSVGWRISMAVDSLGVIHVVYDDGTNGSLKYATNASGHWTNETLQSPSNPSTYSQVAVEIASDGQQMVRRVHILFVSVISDSGWTERLYYINKTGQGSWSQPVRVDPTDNTGRYVSMAISGNGTIYASYLDAYNIRIRVAWGNGSTWHSMDIPKPEDQTGPSDYGVGQQSFVTIGPSGPTLAYLAAYCHLNATGATVLSDRFVLAHFTSTGLKQYSVFDPTGGSQYDLVGMKIHPSGRAILCFYADYILHSAWEVSKPSSPQDFTATHGDGSIRLAWIAPSDNGGSAITNYTVYRSFTEAGPYSALASPSITSFTDTNLTNGQTYWYRISAVNALGEGALTDPVSSTPFTVSDAPTGLYAIPGNAEVTLNWNEPSYDGGVMVDYYVIYKDGVALPDNANQTSAIIVGLSNGQTYSFTVAAHNLAGLGPQSIVASAIPFTIPNAPIGLRSIAGNAQVTLNWTTPGFNGGRTIDYYIVYQESLDVAHSTTTMAIITSLNNGQEYNFTVMAHNAAGNSTQSNSISETPMTMPGAPTGVIATPGPNRVTITWQAPLSTGGSPIRWYTIYRDSIPFVNVNASTMECVDPTGTVGTTYTYHVVAWNAVGNGTSSLTVSASPQADNALLYVGIGAIVIIALVGVAFLVPRKRR